VLGRDEIGATIVALHRKKACRNFLHFRSEKSGSMKNPFANQAVAKLA
jgi:hypothetical protein